MSNPITDARAELANMLVPLGYRIYPYPVENIAPPCIQIFANGDWLVNPRLKGSRDIRLSLRLSAATVSGNEEAFKMLEQMVWDVINLIPASGIIGAPKLDATGSTECYVVDLTLSLSI